LKLSIKHVLIVGIGTILFGTAAIIQTSSYLTTQDVLLEHARQLMWNLSQDTIDRSETFLKPAEAAADLSQRLANHDVVTNTTPEAMERYFFDQMQIYPHISGIYYGTANGSFHFVNRASGERAGLLRTKIIKSEDGVRRVELVWRNKNFQIVDRKSTPDDEYDPRQRPWYKKAVSERKLIWTDPYIFYSLQVPGITTASPVIGEGGVVKGVIGVDVAIAEISTFLSKLKIGDRGSAFILNQNNDVIAFPDAEKIKHASDDKSGNLRFARIDELDDKASHAAFQSLGKSGLPTPFLKSTFTTFELEDETYHSVFAPFNNPNWPWVIGLYVPENDFLGAIKANQTFNIYLTVAIAIIICVFTFFFAHRITRSLNKLRQSAQNIINDNFDENTEIRTPFIEVHETAEAFTRMVASLKEKDEQNAALTGSLRKASVTTILRLSSAAEYKDSDTHEHIQRMSDVSVAIARKMGQAPGWIEMFRYAVAMHDIGKIGVPDRILLKPGPLDPEEWAVMQTHSEIGSAILKDSETDLLEMARIIGLHHHEQWDGSGYPQKLRGTDIPLEARICAVADVFDALVSKRCYKEAIPISDSFDYIKRKAGSQFDPDCVEAFIAAKDDYMHLYQ